MERTQKLHSTDSLPIINVQDKETQITLQNVTNYRGLFACKQAMPWPVWPRDMIFKGTGMFDRKNQACILVVKSIDEDVPYFGVPAPKTQDGHVRLDIKRGYHYLQKIDENKTRYIALFNSDPKLTFMPNWFMNFMMTKVCYQMLDLIETKSKKVPLNEYGKRIRERTDFYGKIQQMLDDDVGKDEEAPIAGSSSDNEQQKQEQETLVDKIE